MAKDSKKSKKNRPEIDMGCKSKKWIMVEDYREKDQKYPQYIKKASVKTVDMMFDKIFDNPNLETLNSFVLKRKQAYYKNTDCHVPYANYFIEFYDPDDEFVLAILKIKAMIDRKEEYCADLFRRDIYRLIITDSMVDKIKKMVRDNYTFNITKKKNKRSSNNTIVYEMVHAHILMDISMAIKLLIPVISHFEYMNKIKDINGFTLSCIEPLYDIMAGDINIKGKLYESIHKLVLSTSRNHRGHWEREEIAGINFESKTNDILDKIMHDIMYKYVFNDNMITFNTKTTKYDLGWSMRGNDFRRFKQLQNIEDEDGLSDIDKLEMIKAKFDEGRLVTSRVNMRQTLTELKMITGLDKLSEEVWDDMVTYYEDNIVINVTQRDLVKQFFGQYFKNIEDLDIPRREYMMLIIILKRMLTNMGFAMFQHMLTSNMVQGPNKKLPKKKIVKILESQKYQSLFEKYEQVSYLLDKHDIYFSYLTIFTNSDYYLVDYDYKDLVGKKLKIPPDSDIVFDEYFKFLNLI